MTVSYRARYDQHGNKTYEEQEGVVLIDRGGEKPNEAGYYVMGDIQPYQSTVTGEMVMGRAQHKAHLKEHKLIEMGNEPIRERKVDSYNSEEVKRELARHLYN